MALYKYAFRTDETKVARAQAYDMDASYKDLANILAAIRGKPVSKARAILDDAIAMRKAIPYRNHNTGMGHRSELGGQKGRYPKKECRLVRALLDNAAANGMRKGFDEQALVIRNASAYKQNVLPRTRRVWPGGATLGYGKQATRSDYTTARMEITLEERPSLKEKAAKEKQEKKAKLAEGGKAAKATAPVKKPPAEKQEHDAAEKKTIEPMSKAAAAHDKANE